MFPSYASPSSTYLHAPALFLLLVSKTETAVLSVNFKNNNIHLITNLTELTWVLQTFCPRKVADVNEAVNTFFQFSEHTERLKMLNCSSMLRANRIFFRNSA